MAEPIVLTLDSLVKNLNIDFIKVSSLPKKYDINSIKEEAKKVVSLRKEHADKVKDYSVKLKGYEKTLLEILSYLEDNMNLDHPETKDKTIEIHDGRKNIRISLVDLCKEIQKIYKEITTELDKLEVRFKNERIRVTSIGEARQGKSLLTQLYTGREDIIKVEGSSQDCTGSICVLHHDDSLTGVDFKADVLFYNREEAFNSLLDLLNSIREKDPNFAKDIIPAQINSFNDVEIIIADKEKQKLLQELTTPSGVELGQLNTLINYFSNNEYISCLSQRTDQEKHEKFENDIARLEEFNYIPSPHPKYLAVKQIDITTNLGHEGLFGFFDIADTRGASDTSGCSNDDIKEAIEDSDAVFSIHRLHKGNVKLNFYDNILTDYKNNNSFIRKHFVIINEEFYSSSDTSPKGDDDKVDTPQCIKQIKKNALTNVFYVGKLKNDVTPEEPKEFANRLMIDMLSKIAKEVREIDQDRIDKCNNKIEKLKDYFSILQRELKTLVLFTEFDKVYYIKKFIDRFAGEISEKLLEEEINLGYNEGAQPDYNKLKEQNDPSIVTLGDILLGRRLEPKDDNLNTIIPLLIKETKEKVENVKLYPHKANSERIGEYLTKFAIECFGQINKTLTDSTDEKIVDISTEKDKLFGSIWECSKIGAIMKEDLPGDKSMKDPSNFVSTLVKLYFDEKHDPFKMRGDVPTPYQLLALYFKSVPEKLDRKSNVNRESVLVDEQLQQKMTQLINEIRLEEYVRKGLVKRNEIIQGLLKNLEGFFNNIYSTDCEDFYLQNANYITSENPEYEGKRALYERDKTISEKREKLFGIIRDIMTMDKLKLPKTSNAKEPNIN